MNVAESKVDISEYFANMEFPKEHRLRLYSQS